MNERARLQRWTKAPTTPQRVVRRSQIVLMALEGESQHAIAQGVGVSVPTVRLWIRRFEQGGAEALLRDAPGRGRRPILDPETVRERLRQGNLLDSGGRPVSLRRAGAYLGVSASAVWRALRHVR